MFESNHPLRLIIGGSSSVGKTTVSKLLCKRFELQHIETDRILPRVKELRPLDGPMENWDRPAMELCEQLISSAQAAIPFLEKQLSSLLANRDKGHYA